GGRDAHRHRPQRRRAGRVGDHCGVWYRRRVGRNRQQGIPYEQDWSMTETQAKSGTAGARTEPTASARPATDEPDMTDAKADAQAGQSDGDVTEAPAESSTTVIRRGASSSATRGDASEDEADDSSQPLTFPSAPASPGSTPAPGAGVAKSTRAAATVRVAAA